MQKPFSLKKINFINYIKAVYLTLFLLLGSAPAYAADVDCNTHNPEVKTAGSIIYILTWCRANTVTSFPVPNAHLGLSYQPAIPPSVPTAIISGTAAGAAPSTANSLRSFNTVSVPTVANHSTTPPTLSSCAALSYTATTPAVANNYYCAKFTDGTDTGYIYGYWNGTTLSLSGPPAPPTPPAATSASAAPETFFNWGLFIISFLFIGFWGYRQYSTVEKS